MGKVIHAIVDNYATHKHPKVRQWLARRPRWAFHFTPTSASWLNAVEGFFAKLTRQRLKRGVIMSPIETAPSIGTSERNRFRTRRRRRFQVLGLPAPRRARVLRSLVSAQWGADAGAPPHPPS